MCWRNHCFLRGVVNVSSNNLKQNEARSACAESTNNGRDRTGVVYSKLSPGMRGKCKVDKVYQTTLEKCGTSTRDYIWLKIHHFGKSFEIKWLPALNFCLCVQIKIIAVQTNWTVKKFSKIDVCYKGASIYKLKQIYSCKVLRVC